MFSGQGAQYYQMGRELYAHDAAYRDALDQCARLCGPIGGRGLTEIVFGRALGDSQGFDTLSETHPILVAQGYALARCLIARGVEPDLLLGYSLGETIAAVVAGALAIDDALHLVREHAAMFETSLAEGAMIAVFAAAETIAADPELADSVAVSAVNAPTHVVLSLPLARVAALTAALDRRRLTWARLPVRVGFHSWLVEPVERRYRVLLDDRMFAPPRLPVFSCATAAPVARFDTQHFWRVTRGAIRFQDTVAALGPLDGSLLLDVGPSGTLAAFVRLCAGPQAPALPAINQFGRDLKTLDAIMERLA
jgi:bacillaene synthase trans-acting acyltransferase/trans-AT polyketide synthase/acyltransferase/oxidoreductase domain-containing protein